MKLNQYREYEDYEFCYDVRCAFVKKGKCTLTPGCRHTAREFHKWLTDNGFKIVKADVKAYSEEYDLQEKKRIGRKNGKSNTSANQEMS